MEERAPRHSLKKTRTTNTLTNIAHHDNPMLIGLFYAYLHPPAAGIRVKSFAALAGATTSIPIHTH
jgi:hypothetical protein